MRSQSANLVPRSELDLQLIRSKWARYLSPNTPLQIQNPMPRFSLVIPDEAVGRIDLEYELDGSGHGTVSIKLPGMDLWWPALLKQFAGAWMLADKVRYSPELLVHKTGGKEDEVQIACDLFIGGVLHGFPLSCLHVLKGEDIRFMPQWFIP